MKIGHAVMNERGTAHGGVPGDSTGKEIRTAEWYEREGGWAQYIEPLDLDMAERAAEMMERICADSRFGYDQDKRWSAYQQIRDHGFDGAGRGDFDCSSLCIACYIFAGADMLPRGSTRDAAKLFEQTGRFKVYTDAEHIGGTDMAVRGGMWCAPGKHICMALETGPDFAKVDESIDITAPFLVVKGSVRVRKEPVDGKTVRIMHKGDIAVIKGLDPSGWYEIEDGFVTGNRKYVDVKNERR